MCGLFHDHQQHKDKRVQELYQHCPQALLQHPQIRQRHSMVPECFFPTVSSTNSTGTVWCANVTIHPTSCTGLHPNYPNSGHYWEARKSEHFQLSAHILSLHWLFTTSKSLPVISKRNTHFSSVYYRPSAASRF